MIKKATAKHDEPLLNTSRPMDLKGLDRCEETNKSRRVYAPALDFRGSLGFGISTTPLGSQLSYEGNGKHSLVTPGSTEMPFK